MEDKEYYTIEEVIDMLCKDNPSFRDKLDEAKKQLDSLTAQEHNELIDNVFRRI